MKKFFMGLLIVLAALIVAVCTLDIGTVWIANKGAQFVADTYGLGVTIGGAKGNPVKGYTFSDIELAEPGGGASLLKAGSISVDPALLKIIRGNIALDWVELTDIKSTIPNLLRLAEMFTGAKVALPDAVPLNELVLNKVGGSLDGSDAEAALDIALNGLPIKGDFKVSLAPGISVAKGEIETAGGVIDVSGAVTPDLDIKARLNKVQIAELAAVVPQIADFGARGLLTADIVAKGTIDNPAVAGKVSLDDGSAMGFPVSAATNVAFENMKVNLAPLSVNAVGIPVSGSASADLNGKVPSVKVAMKTDGAVTAATLAENLPSLPVELGGQVDGVSVAVEGPVTALNGSAQVKADKLTVGGQPITDTLLKADFNSKGVVTMSGGSNIVGNPATLKGTVNAGGKEVAADISFGIKNFDLALLPKLVPSAPANIKGKVNAALTVKGKGSAITAGGQIDSARVSLNDMNIDKINVPVTFSGDTLTFRNASLVFMDLPVSKVNGSVTMGGDHVAFKEMSASVAGGLVTMNSTLKFGKNLNANYDLNIANVDLGSVMKTFGAGSLGASGKLSGAVKGDVSDTDITGDGSLSIPVFSLIGLKFEQIKSSVKLAKMVASLPDFGCNFAGGTVGGAMNVDINKMAYDLKVSLKNSQLKSIIDQMMPTLGGGLSGTLTGDYSASGSLSPFTLDGGGTVSSAGGQVYGFKSLQSVIGIVGKLSGQNAIAYADAKIPFRTSIDKLTLEDGTAINAKQGDALYRHIKAKGTFAYAGALNMDVDASVNAMYVNTAASALTGAVALGGASLLTGGLGGIAGLAAGAVSGAKQSYGKDDYRSLTFNIGGTADSPKMSNFKVGGKAFDAKAAAAENEKLQGTGGVKEKLEDAKEKAKQKVNEAINKAVGGKAPAKDAGKAGASSGKDKVKEQINKQLSNLLKGKKK